MVKARTGRGGIIKQHLLMLSFLLGVALIGASCSKKKVNTSDLEKAFQAADAKLESSKGQDTTQSQTPEVPLKAYVQQASEAIKGNDYAGAIVPLQALRSRPNLTAEQLTTVQDTMAAVQKQLAERADSGDPAAQRALDQIRQSKRAFRQR